MSVPPLPDQFRRHADHIERGSRSPLYAALMRGAAADIEAGGVTVRLLDGDAGTVESVAQLRLLAPLHELALTGRAPALAAYFPTAGGNRGPEGAWPAARDALEEHFDWVRERLPRTVQTNEPGRACVLYAGLRVLAEGTGRPIRLLEIGASAGLNLHVDRYAYRVDGGWLGDVLSPLRFQEPWSGPLGADPVIAERAGCDLHPLDPAREEDRTRLLSYIWPDEPERIERLRAALDAAAQHPVAVDEASAANWLVGRLPARDDGLLTVVWHSVFWQYLPASERKALEALHPTVETPALAWLGMEPAAAPGFEFELTLRGPGDNPPRVLAGCDAHGPPLHR